MYAVIKTGGKQYRVSQDDVIDVEKIEGEAGAAVSFKDVLLVGGDAGVKVGAPTVAGAVVSGEIVEQWRGDKVITLKKRRRKNSRRRRGHRQHLTAVKITKIAG
jgi:large subunit ribosomal protein L21